MVGRIYDDWEHKLYRQAAGRWLTFFFVFWLGLD